MKWTSTVFTGVVSIILFVPVASIDAQIPMERILKRVCVPSEGDTRSLVDTVGFAIRAEQMDLTAGESEKAEKLRILQNRKKYGFDEHTEFIFAISPHDDYILAGRVYTHLYRYVKAKTVIVIGNAHWSEAFGIRNRLIFGNFKKWRAPYGDVAVSSVRDEIIDALPPGCYTVNRTVVETEHSLEALVPFLQHFNRNVEIVPILVPFTDIRNEDELGRKLAEAVSMVLERHNLKLGKDVAILCSTDGQHYGDYGWSYYNFHPYGCDAKGYEQSMGLDNNLIHGFLTGTLEPSKIHMLYAKLIDESNISNYRITWCGRFSVTFSAIFVSRLTQKMGMPDLSGFLLRRGSSLSDQWLPLQKAGLGVTADTNLHHFVTYFAIGFK